MSYVEEAIRNLAGQHALDVESGVDHPKKVNAPCELASGIETTFVATFIDYARASTDLEIPFHQFFYIPNTLAESLVGYDLSIGYYETQQRIRTMHKVVYKTWCDQEWEWSLTHEVDRHGRLKGDYLHFITLLEHYRNFPDLVPFLVFHVCYCIHDYRRMGTEYREWRVPSFNSILRTVVVSLVSLSEQIADIDAMTDNNNFRLSIRKTAPQKNEEESISDYLNRISQKDNYIVEIQPGNTLLDNCIFTLDEFCMRVNDLVNEQ